MVRKINYDIIFCLLDKASSESLSPKELTKLVTIIRELIHPYIFHTKKEQLLYFQKYGYSEYDLSMDVVVEFLRKDSNGNYVVINNLLEHFIEINNTEDKVTNFLKLQSLLRKICDNCVAKIYSEFDEDGAKIIRNIKNALPSDKLNIRRTLIGLVIYLNNHNSNSYELITYDDLKHHFMPKSGKKKLIPELLDELANRMEEFDFKSQEILLNDVVKLFRTYYNRINDLVNDDELDNSITFQFDLNSIDFHFIEDRINKKITEILYSYYTKSKLTNQQIEALFKTIKDIFFDLVHFNQLSFSLYEYFNNHYTCSVEEYNLKFKTKLEYLNKIIREHLINYLLL
jgi:hypothetical protein